MMEHGRLGCGYGEGALLPVAMRRGQRRARASSRRLGSGLIARTWLVAVAWRHIGGARSRCRAPVTSPVLLWQAHGGPAATLRCESGRWEWR